MNATRRPRGYVGEGHETVGSDVLAVYRCLVSPEKILGQETAAKLAAIDPQAWYPIEWLLDLMELLARELGETALRKMGRTLFSLTHEEHVKATARSARDIIYGLDVLYHRANRGNQIGGWTVTRFEPGRAELDKTTPHHCVMEEGILGQALQAVGVPTMIEQERCFRRGDDSCLYVLTSPIRGAKWMGEPLTRA